MPRSRVRTDTAWFNLSSIDSPVLWILTDELDEDLIQLGFCRPINPALNVWLEVSNPEPAKQCRVHIIDVVLITDIYCREDSSLRVKTDWVTIFVVAKLSIKNNLEETLHDARHRAIELVQHQNAGFLSSTDEPAGQTKA